MQTSLINWYLLTQLSKKINGTFSAQSTYQASKDMLVGHHSILQALAVTIFKHLSKPISKLPQNFQDPFTITQKIVFLKQPLMSCATKQSHKKKWPERLLGCKLLLASLLWAWQWHKPTTGHRQSTRWDGAPPYALLLQGPEGGAFLPMNH